MVPPPPDTSASHRLNSDSNTNDPEGDSEMAGYKLMSAVINALDEDIKMDSDRLVDSTAGYATNAKGDEVEHLSQHLSESNDDNEVHELLGSTSGIGVTDLTSPMGGRTLTSPDDHPQLHFQGYRHRDSASADSDSIVSDHVLPSSRSTLMPAAGASVPNSDQLLASLAEHRELVNIPSRIGGVKRDKSLHSQQHHTQVHTSTLDPPLAGPAALDKMRAKVSIPSRTGGGSHLPQVLQRQQETVTKLRGSVMVPPRSASTRATPDRPDTTSVTNPSSHPSPALLARKRAAVHIPDRGTKQSTVTPASNSNVTRDNEGQNPQTSAPGVAQLTGSILQNMKRMVSIPWRQGSHDVPHNTPISANPTLDGIRSLPGVTTPEPPQRPVSAYPNVLEPLNLESLAAARRAAAIPPRDATMPSSSASRQYVVSGVSGPATSGHTSAQSDSLGTAKAPTLGGPLIDHRSDGHNSAGPSNGRSQEQMDWDPTGLLYPWDGRVRTPARDSSEDEEMNDAGQGAFQNDDEDADAEMVEATLASRSNATNKDKGKGRAMDLPAPLSTNHRPGSRPGPSHSGTSAPNVTPNSIPRPHVPNRAATSPPGSVGSNATNQRAGLADRFIVQLSPEDLNSIIQGVSKSLYNAQPVRKSGPGRRRAHLVNDELLQGPPQVGKRPRDPKNVATQKWVRNGLYKLLLGNDYDPESRTLLARDVLHRCPSPEELERFEADPKNPNLGPTPENFTIHIYGPTGTFSHEWNQKGFRIARRLAYPSGTNALAQDYADYKGRYETAWGYLRQLADNPPESKPGEQRRIQLCYRREAAADKLSKQSVHPNAGLALEIVKELTTFGMSEDEYQCDDSGNIDYDSPMTAIPMEWRSDEATFFLQALDRWARKTRATKGIRGAAPTLRVYINQEPASTDVYPAVRSLPRNCYRASWLATLPPEDILALDIKEELFDFDSALDFASFLAAPAPSGNSAPRRGRGSAKGKDKE